MLIFASACLLALSTYRAATFPFTHDEASSFFLLDWFRFSTANNHMLNTLLMKWCSALFGNSELSLRLPNLVAHALYLAGTLAFLRRFTRTSLMVAGFAALNLNPFVLDFFFLARGYGLALALMMLSLHLLARAHDAKDQDRFGSYVYLSCIFGSLAVLANFAFLNYYLPLLAAGLWLLLTDTSLRRFSPKHLREALLYIFASGFFLALIFSFVSELRQSDQLFFGGNAGFVTDSIGSLVRCSLYTARLSLPLRQAIVAMVVGSFAVLFFLGVWVFFARREAPLFVLLLLVLSIAAALPIMQHELFKVLFPIERVTLCYLPMYLALVLAAVDWMLRQPVRLAWLTPTVQLASIAVSVLLTVHFCRAFDPRFCLSWGYDRHNVEALELIDRDRKVNFPGRSVNLYNSWLVNPSVEFYRVTRGYSWLNSGIRETMMGSCPTYLFLHKDELKEAMAWQATTLASYPDTGTVVVRWNPATWPESVPQKKSENQARSGG